MTGIDQHLEGFMSVEERAAIRSPLEQARAFPDRTFASPAFFDFEQAKVVGANWVALAFEGQVPDIGDAAPVDAYLSLQIAQRWSRPRSRLPPLTATFIDDLER